MEKSSDMNGETRWINDDMEVDIELDKKHETEILRIISQYLIEKGLSESAKTLQHETGVDLEGEAIQNFRSLVLEGKFDEVIRLIYEIEYDTESISRVKLAIYEQKYLELVEKRDTVNALACLRNELIQSTKQIEEYDNYKGRKSLTKEKIKILSSIIMCKNLNEIQNFIDWDGAEGSSRKRLLDELQSYISPQKMLESGRLETLLKQIAYQINSCKFHDWKQKDYAYSFLEKHKCDKIPLPSKYLNSIQVHNDEIWYLSISPNGARLASAGRDKLINIWDLKWNGETLEIKLITCIKKSHAGGNESDINSIMWNKNSDKLLTASDNAKIFNVLTGECIKDFKGNSGKISCALWVDNDTKIITAEVEKCMKLWSVDGNLLHTWKDFCYIDVVCNKENNLICFHAGSNKIKVLDLDTKLIVASFEEEEKIRSISMSGDGKFLLTNCSEVNPAINLWSIDQK